MFELNTSGLLGQPAKSQLREQKLDAAILFPLSSLTVCLSLARPTDLIDAGELLPFFLLSRRAKNQSFDCILSLMPRRDLFLGEPIIYTIQIGIKSREYTAYKKMI